MTRVLMRPAGLALGENSVAPREGGMRVATNVVCDQLNSIRARQTNAIHTTKTGETNSGWVPRALAVYDGSVYAYSTDGLDWRVESTAGVLESEVFTPPTHAQIPVFSQSRSTLYYATNIGVRRYQSTDDEFMSAGVEPYATLFVTGNAGVASVGSVPNLDGRFYFDTSTVRSGDTIEWYRSKGTSFLEYVVIKRTSAASKYARRSPPARLGFSGTAVPQPDAYLAAEYVVTDTDVTNGYVLIYTIVSTIPSVVKHFIKFASDDLLGEALYTNPGQGGALAAKYPPPCAAYAANWAGVTWYGNTVSKHRFFLSVQSIYGSTDFTDLDSTNPKGLLGAVTSGTQWSGTTTVGSAVIVGVGDDIGGVLRVGQTITDSTSGPANAGTAIPAGSTVVSWAAGAPGTVDITISANCTAAGSRNVYLSDVVTIAGRSFYAWNIFATWTPDEGLAGGRRTFSVANGDFVASQRIPYTAAALAGAINYESVVDPTFRVRAIVLGEPFVRGTEVFAAGDLMLEEIGVGGAAFTVQTSNPSAFSPVIDSAQTANGTSTNNAGPGLIWYSDIDEPESVPLANFIAVGDVDRPVLALTPLRSSLLVWKTDGLFRVSGTAPRAWRVDMIDAHVRLLSAGVVDTTMGAAFAWTDMGVVRATESGISVVSQAIEPLLKVPMSDVVDDGEVTGWAQCWRTEGLFLLGLPGDNPGSRLILCLSIDTGLWTRFWARSDEEVTACYYDPVDHRMYWARSVSWEVRVFDREPKGYDASYLLTGMTISSPYESMVVPSSGAGTWRPIAGDWIKRTASGQSSYARVVEVSFASGEYTIDLSPALAGGTGAGVTFTAYEGVAGVCEWQQVEQPGVWGRYREMQLSLDSSVDGASPMPSSLWISMGGQTSTSGTVMVSATVGQPMVSRPYRFGVPRAIGLHSHFYPRLEVNALGYPWRIGELVVVGTPGSERIRK